MSPREGELVVTFHWLTSRPELSEFCDKNARGDPVSAQAIGNLVAPRDDLKLFYVDLASDGGMSRIIWATEDLIERRTKAGGLLT